MSNTTGATLPMLKHYIHRFFEEERKTIHIKPATDLKEQQKEHADIFYQIRENTGCNRGQRSNESFFLKIHFKSADFSDEVFLTRKKMMDYH